MLGLSAGWSYLSFRSDVPHCHDILLQIWMEGGFVGLALYLGLMIYFLYHACQLWKRWELPLWQRALPLPVLALLAMEMVECLTHFAYGHVPMTALYFFIGSTVAVSREIGKKTGKA